MMNIDTQEKADAINRLAREQMKLKLLQDIRVDLMICEIEGYDKKQYINELRDMIDTIAAGCK